MNTKKLIKETEVFVKECLTKEGSHDWWHIERVRNNAKAILKHEKADAFVVDMSLLLHDVGDRKVTGKSENDYSIADSFLKSKEIQNEIREHIMYIVKNMSYSASLDKQEQLKTKEFLVVQDADRLDALGAIGIARVFSYGGKKLHPLFDPTKKIRKIKSQKEYHEGPSSAFHHFYEKILLLKDTMNTKTAKKIATKRHAFLEKYMEQFLAEWEGKR